MIKTTKILSLIYLAVVLLFLLDFMTGFEIKNQSIKSFVYGATLTAPVIFILNIFFFETKMKRIIILLLSGLMLLFLFNIGPLKIGFSSSVWQTQTILYQNKELSFKKIEMQLQDIGALGYNKRTVQVIYLTNWFTLVQDVPKDIDQNTEWTKVNIFINDIEVREP